MQGYVKALIQRFDNSTHLAEFTGVSVNTVWSWTAGTRQPTGPTLRMLQVLGILVLDAPHVFDALLGKEAPLKCKPIVLPPLQALPKHHSEHIQAERVPMWTPLTPQQIVERDARNLILDPQCNDPLASDPFELATDLAAGQAVVSSLLLGKTRAQWLNEWNDDNSAAIAGLSEDEFDRVCEWIGK